MGLCDRGLVGQWIEADCQSIRPWPPRRSSAQSGYWFPEAGRDLHKAAAGGSLLPPSRRGSSGAKTGKSLADPGRGRLFTLYRQRQGSGRVAEELTAGSSRGDYDLRPLLTAGDNVVAVMASNLQSDVGGLCAKLYALLSRARTREVDHQRSAMEDRRQGDRGLDRRGLRRRQWKAPPRSPLWAKSRGEATPFMFHRRCPSSARR